MSSRAIRIVVPAEAEHIPLLRTAVSGVAARHGFTLEEMDDLRMGVEEAAVLLLRQSNGEPITLELALLDDRIDATVSTVTAGEGPAVDPQSFSWRILSSLADEVHTEHDGPTARIVLTKRPTQSLSA